jgi:hypothetical protein
MSTTRSEIPGWTRRAYDRRPLAMARCADVDDVRRCVEFARKHAIPVAIRGGGHSYAGFGVADGALQAGLALAGGDTAAGTSASSRGSISDCMRCGPTMPLRSSSAGATSPAPCARSANSCARRQTRCARRSGWMRRRVRRRTADSTAYPLRGTGLSSLLSAEWKRPQDRDAAVAWVAEHGAALRSWARRAYVNYLAQSSPERVREVYGVNYPRLARVKARYDSANLFRSNQNVVPAAPAEP